jgi:hypothetical protein
LEGSLGHIAAIVAVEERPPDVITAFTLSAGARTKRSSEDTQFAFFERVHLRAENRGAATNLLGVVLRDKAISTVRGPSYLLRNVKFGTWPITVRVEEKKIRTGSPISWTRDQVARGMINFSTLEGNSNTLTWADASDDPGWIEMDWIFADPESGKMVDACNVLEATWESPDGAVTPLDGFLDPYFQEVYPDVDTIPLFSRFVDEIGADSVSDYVDRLTEEVYEFTVTRPNYGKAARRMYNIFRLTGRYTEAARIRAIFDGPTTALYQVAVSLRNLHETKEAAAGFELGGMVTQVDQLIMSAIAALEPRSETEVVDTLIQLREAINTTGGTASALRIAEARTDAMSAVDKYYRRALIAVPGMTEYLASLTDPGRCDRSDPRDALRDPDG